MTAITSFHEADEVLKSKHVAPGGHIGYPSEPFLGGSVLTLHGETHFERRRLESPLFRRELLAVYENSHLRPVLRARLNRLRTDDGRPVRTDLLLLTRTVLQVIAAKVIGLDKVNDEDSVDRLRFYSEEFGAAMSAQWATQDQGALTRRGLEA